MNNKAEQYISGCVTFSIGLLMAFVFIGMAYGAMAVFAAIAVVCMTYGAWLMWNAIQ